ncbi:MAG: hypothetical protein AAGE96_13215 [Cyanobacteria bacterium P01_G01_bin.19]
MSALRQSDFETQYYPSKPQSKLETDSYQQPVKLRGKQVRKVVKNRSFPQQNRLPQNLQLLSILQKGSFTLALFSMLASIGLYSSTVRIPELWSQEYRNLEDLQRQERELTAINEKIKYQIAHEASQDSRLSISTPESAVFVSPAKIDLKKPTAASDHISSSKIKQNILGY